QAQRAEAETQRRAVEARNQQLKALADFQSRWLSRADVTELSRDLLVRLRSGIDAAAGEPAFADLDREQLDRFFDRLSASAIPADVARAALAAQLLHPALEEIERLLAGPQAEVGGVEPALRASLGRAYHDLGLFQEAATQLEQAVGVLARSEPEDSAELLRARLSWLEARFQLGEYAEGLPEARRVLALTSDGGDTELELLAGTALARLLLESGDADAALVQLETSLALAQQRGLSGEDPQVLRIRQQRARALARKSRYPEVLAETQALRAVLEKAGGRSSRQLRNVYGSLVEAAYMVRDLSTAREVAAIAYERTRQDLGETHPETLGALQNYANVQFADEQYDAARTLQEHLVEQRARTLGIEHPLTLAARFNLALTLYNMGRYEDALRLRQAVLEARRRRLGAEHQHTLSTASVTARTLNALGRHAQALELIETTLATLVSRQGESHTDTLIAREVRASVLQGLGRTAEALAELRRAHDGTLAHHGPAHRRTQTLQDMLRRACQGRREAACQLPPAVTAP
ncbi:MAG TPA: tetratricopeptide repeat protein, partial [Nevskiaceae bacterium]|nr:tetratricopeptide repeat protein [Nevskiaceae bacterium]